MEAIKSTTGPVLIIAGPGSGKTFTLVERIVYLIKSKGASPESLFVVTFTDRAARELTTPFSELKTKFDLNEMYLGTFHSICLRILEDYREYTRPKRNLPGQSVRHSGLGPRAASLVRHWFEHNGERQQVIERYQQRRAKGDRNGLLGRGQRRLQAVRCMTAVVNAVAVLPFIHRLLGRAEAFSQGRCRLVTRLDRRPYLWCRRRLFVKMDQHGCT